MGLFGLSTRHGYNTYNGCGCVYTARLERHVCAHGVLPLEHVFHSWGTPCMDYLGVYDQLSYGTHNESKDKSGSGRSEVVPRALELE